MRLSNTAIAPRLTLTTTESPDASAGRFPDEPDYFAGFRGYTYQPTLFDDDQTQTPAIDVPYGRVWMNWYRDHQDGTGWRADRPAHQAPTAIVPGLSLGAPRRFLVRPSGGGPSTVFTPAGGDLIIMQGRCQRDWQHCVPKQKAPVGRE